MVKVILKKLNENYLYTSLLHNPGPPDIFYVWLEEKIKEDKEGLEKELKVKFTDKFMEELRDKNNTKKTL